MYSDGTILTELGLGLMNLGDEINERFCRSRNLNPIIGPIGELELPQGPRLSILSVSDSKLP